MTDEPKLVEFPFYYRPTRQGDAYEVLKTANDVLVGTFETELYADYVSSLMNFAHALGNQAKTLAEL